MKKYFLYRFKKSLPALALVATLAVVAYVIPIALKDFSHWNLHNGKNFYVELYIGNILTVLGLSSAFAPFYFLYYKLNKRGADMYYSLPISRRKLFFVQYSVGFICVVIAYSAGYLLGFLTAIAKARGLNYIYYLWIYLASLAPAYILYSIVSFAVARANTLWDAVIFAAAYCFAPTVLLCFLSGFLKYVQPIKFWLGAPLVCVEYLTDGILRFGSDMWNFSAEANVYKIYASVYELCGCITAAALSAAATVAMFVCEKNFKAENCGQISNTLLGYKILIPLYLIGLSALTGDLWVICVLAFAAFAATVIWKRTIKIGCKQAVLFAVYVTAALIVSVISKEIGASDYYVYPL